MSAVSYMIVDDAHHPDGPRAIVFGASVAGYVWRGGYSLADDGPDYLAKAEQHVRRLSGIELWPAEEPT